MLQRIYRGFRGRMAATARDDEVKKFRQDLLFQYFAEVIQRTFRGFHSRKVKHDFHARKKYIADMVLKSEELQTRLNQYAEEAAAKHAKEAKERRDRKLVETTTRLNYLVSTKAQRGVMNAPGAHTPTIDGLPVEKVITKNVKEYLRKNKLDVRKPASLKPGKLGASLRASSPFDVVEERQRQEKKWSKLRRVNKKDFLGGTKAAPPKYTRGIQEGCEYIEPRVLALSTKEKMAKQKDKFMSPKPFLMAVKSGRLFEDSE